MPWWGWMIVIIASAFFVWYVLVLGIFAWFMRNMMDRW